MLEQHLVPMGTQGVSGPVVPQSVTQAPIWGCPVLGNPSLSNFVFSTNHLKKAKTHF